MMGHIRLGVPLLATNMGLVEVVRHKNTTTHLLKDKAEKVEEEMVECQMGVQPVITVQAAAVERQGIIAML